MVTQFFLRSLFYVLKCAWKEFTEFFFCPDNQSTICEERLRVYLKEGSGWVEIVTGRKLAVYVHKCRFCGHHKDECVVNKLCLFIFSPLTDLSVKLME